MKNIDILEIEKRLKAFDTERDWSQFHSVKNLTMALSVEASELVEIFQWATEEESNNARSNESVKAKVSNEIADIFIYLLKIASLVDVDIEKSVLEKIIENSKKYPADKVRGKAIKYTDL